MSHRGYIGNLQHAFLAGLAAAESTFYEDISKEQMIPIDGIFYVAAFQNGIEYFIGPSIHQGAEHLEFIENKLIKPKDDSLIIHIQISEIFNSFRTSEDEERYIGDTTSMFISELINSMVNKASMLSVVSIPQKDKIEELYAPELSIPLVQLMAQFQTYSESMPVPTTNIEHANLNRFHRILESQAFSKYSKAHSALENPSSNSAEVLSNIRLASDVLLHEGKRLIGLRQTIFHLLKLAPKVIDDVFGKLPGSLAHIAGNIAQDRLNDEKEVVIYELDKTLFNILKLRAPKE